MNDQDKTREQLISELKELRGRVSALEASETEWRRTEEALQESEERFRLLVEAIPQPIWRSDADGNVIDFNRRWYEYTGQTAEEAKGSGWTKALHSDEAAMVVQAVRASMTSGTSFEIVNRLRRAADGSYRWHLARAVPMNDRGGKIIGWFGCVTDIDDQKRAEVALQDSEERFKLFMDNSPAIAWMKDEQGRYVYFSKSYEKRVGVRLEDCCGKTDFELWPGETAEQFWKNDQAVLSCGHVVELIEESSAPDGNRRYWWNFKFPFRDSVGRRFVAGVGLDITERKRAEEALQKAHNELERRVEERTAELAKANEELAFFRRVCRGIGARFQHG